LRLVGNTKIVFSVTGFDESLTLQFAISSACSSDHIIQFHGNPPGREDPGRKSLQPASFSDRIEDLLRILDIFKLRSP